MAEDKTLQFLPIKEISTMREQERRQRSFTVTEEERELEAGDGISFELKMKIDLEATDAERLELSLRCGDGEKTVCLFDFRYAELSVDRNHADGWSKGISRSAMNLSGKKELDVHIFSDCSSIEIFTDGYRNNHSNNIYAGPDQRSVVSLREITRTTE